MAYPRMQGDDHPRRAASNQYRAVFPSALDMTRVDTGIRHHLSRWEVFMCGLLRAQPFVTSASLESLLSRRRSRTPRLWRRRKLRQGAKVPDHAVFQPISQTDPCGHHRVDLTDPGGSIAPAPTATTCSHSCGPHVGRSHRAGTATRKTKPSGLPTPAAGFAINARSTPKPGVSTAHANKKSPTAHGATTCAKCSSCSKAPNRAPAPGAPGSTTHSNPNNSHPTGNHHPPPHQLDDEPPF